MTNRVDRLAARRLVSRREHPADGRGVLVQLTEHGRETVDATLADLLTAERTMLDRLTEPDRAQLVRTLRRLLSR
jgi:DNA-binding MarR family transcriptional regulator